MQFLTDSKINFMKYRAVFVWVSLALLVVSVIELSPLLGIGLNLGIDFAGGTQLTIAVADDVDNNDVRRTLQEAGLDASIQRFGDTNEIMIKTPVVSQVRTSGTDDSGGADSADDTGETATDDDSRLEEGSGDLIIAALNEALNPQAGPDSFDLNLRGTKSLAALLFDADPDALRAAGDDQAARVAYEEIAGAVIDRREEVKLFSDKAQLGDVAELSQAARELIEQRSVVGSFHVLQNENVGPQIGSELREKGIYAVVLSLLGMLAYIWFRFELRFGVGALVAVFHDFLITLGLFALANFEFNLPTIAAFLTLVGYSVNDTVVIFDRVRENMGKHKRLPLVDVMNLSINQTLSRTVLTSGTTLLVVTCLFLLGGEAIRGFAFVLLIGVIIGTYSSVFVASPFTLLWEKHFGREAKEKRLRAATKKA